MATYAVHSLTFEIDSTPAATPTLINVSDVETLDDAINDIVVEYTSLDNAGWLSRAITGKDFVFSLAGKRNIGDVGNDYISALALGDAANQNNQKVTITFPLQATESVAATLLIPCVIGISKAVGGGSADLGGLEWSVMSDGKPTYTPGVPIPFTAAIGTTSKI